MIIITCLSSLPRHPREHAAQAIPSGVRIPTRLHPLTNTFHLHHRLDQETSNCRPTQIYSVDTLYTTVRPQLC